MSNTVQITWKLNGTREYITAERKASYLQTRLVYSSIYTLYVYLRACFEFECEYERVRERNYELASIVTSAGKSAFVLVLASSSCFSSAVAR